MYAQPLHALLYFQAEIVEPVLRKQSRDHRRARHNAGAPCTCSLYQHLFCMHLKTQARKRLSSVLSVRVP